MVGMRKAWGYLRLVVGGDEQAQGGASRWTRLASAAKRVRPALREPLHLPDEFEDLQSALGAEPTAGSLEDALHLRDVALAGLAENLAHLRPLGDQLAESEKARLAAQARVEALEAERETFLELLASRAVTTAIVDDLEAELKEERRARKRVEAQLVRTRQKLEERHRKATERWREIVDLKGERRRLREALQAGPPND